MTTNQDYERRYDDYIGKKVTLLLDGRGHDSNNRSADSNTSLELTGTFNHETSLDIVLMDFKLESNGFRSTNRQHNSDDKPKAMGTFAKEYVIGMYVTEDPK